MRPLITLVLPLVLVGLACPAPRVAHGQLAGTSPTPLAAAEREQINAALPSRAPTAPRQPRRLLIFGLNVGYPGHGSIRHADYALTAMGQRTGAYESVVSSDPEMFRADQLRQFDAVFFNNNVGNLFRDPQLRQNLVEFVYGGGGMLGVHGTTVAFTQWPGAIEDWPEFGRMIGGRGANHKDSNEHVWIKLDDPTHPLVKPFGGQSFDFRDEFFRVHEPYSRDRVRVLLSIDVERTDLTQGGPPRGKALRADNDYALAWIRSYGRGRTGYCTIAHNPYVFWDARMLEFYLGLIQFALGDLPAPTSPSAQLTPAVRAQEQLQWCLELDAGQDNHDTLFDLAARAQQLQLRFVGGNSQQLVSSEIAQPFDHRLSADQQRAIRLRLDDAQVRLMTYTAASAAQDVASLQDALAFARKMGAEVLVVDEPKHNELPLASLQQLAEQYGVRIATRTGSGTESAPPRSNSAVHAAHVGRQWDLSAAGAPPTDPQAVIVCTLPAEPADQTLQQSRIDRSVQTLAIERNTPLIFRIASPSAEAFQLPAGKRVMNWFDTLSLRAAANQAK